MSALAPPRTTFFPPRSRYPPLVRCACVGTSRSSWAKARWQLPLRHRRQHRLTFGRRAQGGDQPATQHHRREIRFEHEALAEGFHQDGELDRAAADAAVLRRERQTEPTELGELRPDLAVPAGIARGDLLHGAVVVSFVQKLVGALAQDGVLGGVSKVHGVSRNRMKRCAGVRSLSPRPLFKHRSRPRLSQRASPRTRFTGPCHSIPRGP